MMKTTLLLAFAALISGFTVKGKDNNKAILRELVKDLDDAIINTPNETHKGKPIYLVDLAKTNSGLKCEPHYFCQAENELLHKVSVLSGTKFERFRKDKTLMRNLRAYNEQHEKNYEKKFDESVKEKLERIPLEFFLKFLQSCVKKVYSIKHFRTEQVLPA